MDASFKTSIKTIDGGAEREFTPTISINHTTREYPGSKNSTNMNIVGTNVSNSTDDIADACLTLICEYSLKKPTKQERKKMLELIAEIRRRL